MSDPENRFFERVIINALTVGLRHIDPLSLDDTAARRHYEELAAREVAQVRAYGQPDARQRAMADNFGKPSTSELIEEMTTKVAAAPCVRPIEYSRGPIHFEPIEITGNHGKSNHAQREFAEAINAVAARRRGRP